MATLVRAGAVLGATFWACEMGRRAAGLATADLRDDLDYAEGGIIIFLNDASASGASFFI